MSPTFCSTTSCQKASNIFSRGAWTAIIFCSRVGKFIYENYGFDKVVTKLELQLKVTISINCCECFYPWSIDVFRKWVSWLPVQIHNVGVKGDHVLISVPFQVFIRRGNKCCLFGVDVVLNKILNFLKFLLMLVLERLKGRKEDFKKPAFFTCREPTKSRSSLRFSVFLMTMWEGEMSVLMVWTTTALLLLQMISPVRTPTEASRRREPPTVEPVIRSRGLMVSQAAPEAVKQSDQCLFSKVSSTLEEFI